MINGTQMMTAFGVEILNVQKGFQSLRIFQGL